MEELEVETILNTNKLQRKLEAISKHTQALVDELKEVDRLACPECGSELEESKQYRDNELCARSFVCKECGYSHAKPEEDMP